MKAYRSVEVKLLSFHNITLYGGDWSRDRDFIFDTTIFIFVKLSIFTAYNKI